MKKEILNQEQGNDNTKELAHKTFLLQNLKKVEQTCWESIDEIVLEKDFRQLEGHFLVMKQTSKLIIRLEQNLKLVSAHSKNINSSIDKH